MTTPEVHDLQQFHKFLCEKLSNGPVDLSPEEALDEWRHGHPDSRSLDEDLSAIRTALSDLANGDQGVMFEEFDREFRARHNIPGRP